MIDRIVLNEPVTPNHMELECECGDDCGRMFTYFEVYKVCLDWIEEHKHPTINTIDNYRIIHTMCPAPRPGDIVAYVDYKGAILASVYAEKWEAK